MYAFDIGSTISKGVTQDDVVGFNAYLGVFPAETRPQSVFSAGNYFL